MSGCHMGPRAGFWDRRQTLGENRGDLRPPRGAQWVKHLTLDSDRVVISQRVSSSPESGSVLTVRNLLGILSLFLSLPLPCSHCVSLSLSLRINKYVLRTEAI